jgi:hypothetical protein
LGSSIVSGLSNTAGMVFSCSLPPATAHSTSGRSEVISYVTSS